MRTNLLLLWLLITTYAIGQSGSFSINTNADMVSMNDALKVSFMIENLDGKFEPPSFDDFMILSGPNTSTSMQISNGQVSKKSSYSYLVKPRKEGTLYINEAYLEMADTTLVSQPIEIEVVNQIDDKYVPSEITQRLEWKNGLGIVTNNQNKDLPKRKKRKIVKI